MKRPLLALAFAGLLPASALAATDGTLGDTSTGSIDLTLNVAEPGPQIQITGFTDQVVDIELGSTETVTQLQDLCVYMTAPGVYDLSWTAEPLSDGTNSIPYTFSVNDNIIEGGFSNSNNTISASSAADGSIFGISPSLTPDCTGDAPIVRVGVGFSKGPPIRNTPLDNATAEITITVTPQ